MVNLMMSLLEIDRMEVELFDPAHEMERLCKRALASRENGDEAGRVTRVLSAAQF